MQLRVLILACAFCLLIAGAALIPQSLPVAAEDTPAPRLYFPHIANNYCGPFLDLFDDPNVGWFTGAIDGLRAEVIDGEYRLEFAGRGTVWLMPAPVCELSAYRAAVDARWVGAPGNFIGLLFNIDDAHDRARLFAVNTDTQVWLVFNIDKGDLNIEIAPVSSDAILPGDQANRLEVRRSGEHITLSVNSTVVGGLRDAHPGAFVLAGVAAASYTTQLSAGASFDNFLYEAE